MAEYKLFILSGLQLIYKIKVRVPADNLIQLLNEVMDTNILVHSPLTFTNTFLKAEIYFPFLSHQHHPHPAPLLLFSWESFPGP